MASWWSCKETFRLWRKVEIFLSPSLSHLLPSSLPHSFLPPFTPPLFSFTLFSLAISLFAPPSFSLFFSFLCLLVFYVLCLSRGGFLWWPNYEIQQANWGCLKQGLLGRLAAAWKRLLGHSEPVLMFTHLHINRHTCLILRHTLSITVSSSFSNLEYAIWRKNVCYCFSCGHLWQKQGWYIFTIAHTSTRVVWRVNGLYFCKLNKSNPLVTPLVMAYLIWI